MTNTLNKNKNINKSLLRGTRARRKPTTQHVVREESLRTRFLPRHATAQHTSSAARGEGNWTVAQGYRGTWSWELTSSVARDGPIWWDFLKSTTYHPIKPKPNIFAKITLNPSDLNTKPVISKLTKLIKTSSSSQANLVFIRAFKWRVLQASSRFLFISCSWSRFESSRYNKILFFFILTVHIIHMNCSSSNTHSHAIKRTNDYVKQVDLLN